MLRLNSAIFFTASLGLMLLLSQPCPAADSESMTSIMITRSQLMHVREYPDALKNAQACVKREPTNPIHFRDMGECEYRMGRYADAIQHLTQSIALKDYWLTRQLRYLVYMELGEFQKALNDCLRCLELNSGLHSAERDLVNICSRLPNDKTAQAALEKLKKSDPISAARAMMRTDRYKEAAELLTTALKKPMPAEVRLEVLDWRKRCHVYLHEHRKVLADLNEMIRIKPDCRAYIFLQRSNAESALKMYAQSAKDLSRVISMKPTAKEIHLTSDELFYRRAACYIETGEYAKAIEDYNTLLKMDKTQEEAYKLRGECYAKLGKHQLALNDFANAIKYDSESSGSTYYSRSLLYDKMGKTKEATADRKRAKELGHVHKPKSSILSR